jgi:RNA polymerase sigma-70 factor (ECF subfamily)
MNSKDNSERELLKKAKDGDRNSFNIIVKNYYKKGYSVAYRYTGNSRDSEDLLQDAFLKVFKNMDSFDLEKDFGPWFFKILINGCINFLRRKKLKRALFSFKEDYEEIGIDIEQTREYSNSENPEKDLAKSELSVKLWGAINKLPEKQRSAIVLADIEGFSYEEISNILKCPIGSVMSRLYYGRLKLKHYLKNYFKEKGNIDEM